MEVSGQRYGLPLDHTPTAMDLQQVMLCKIWPKNLCRLNREALQRADRESLASLFSDLPSIPWQTDINERVDLLSTWIHTVLTRAFLRWSKDRKTHGNCDNNELPSDTDKEHYQPNWIRPFLFRGLFRVLSYCVQTAP